MPSPLRGQDIGFLDDLFVDPKYRGQKIGEKMLNELKKISKSNSTKISIVGIVKNKSISKNTKSTEEKFKFPKKLGYIHNF